MSRYSRGLRFGLLGISPELEALQTVAEQRAAWHAVQRQVWRAPYPWFISLLAPAVFGFGIRFLMRPFGAALHVYSIMPPRVYEVLFMAALSLSCSILSLWLLRGRFRRSMRVYLNEHGVPWCVICGLNRSGDNAERCPECGARSRSVGRRAPDERSQARASSR